MIQADRSGIQSCPRLRDCRQRRQGAQRELDRQRSASERLARDEAVVTLDALARVRRRRDVGWLLIRRRFVDAAPVSDAEIGAFTNTSTGTGIGVVEELLAEAYEESVRVADALADRRFDKGEAAAKLTVTLRRVAEQEELLASLRDEEEALVGERDRHDAAWRALWSETSLEPLSPDEMLEWLSTRKEALDAAVGDSNRLRAAKAERTRMLDALREAGDGLPVETLREECEGVDVDRMQARETSLTRELEDLRERLLEARERRTAARQAFEAMGGAGDDKAARAAADRQAALAEMRGIAEQYVRARSAALLLQWVIDRYRIEKQASLLRSAGALFAILTGGSFESLRVNFDDQDRAHLVGVRRDGAEVAVPGMSTGTADQLYLALRIGSVEDYLARADPLPFIADDLFINFDDARVAAGIQVLGRLATKTQVLFFTHHWHLVDIVRATLGGTVPVVELGEVAGA